MPVLQSGVIPYGYVVPGPVKTATHAPGSLLQPSGLLFEQAAWVLMAELRRYNVSGMFNTAEVAGIPTLNNYPDRRFPVNNVYDPSPTGAYLASYTPAFLLNLTNIGSIRNLMTTLFFGPAGVGGLGNSVATDWFTEAFRNHPRGTNSNPFFSQDIFAHPMSQNGTSSVGVILDTPTVQEDAFFSGRSYYPLGSSGVLYDIDLAELMYQPWPRLSSSFGVGTSIFGGGSAPFFPQFQTTVGVFIAVSNGGRTKFWEDGNLTLRGDVLVPGTEALITQTNDFSGSNLIDTLVFVEPGLASLPAFDSRISTIAEAAFTTVPLSSGSYRLGVRLLKTVNANVVIPSGVRSSVFPAINQSTEAGLHVFNDAIFLEDNTAASVLSPITNDFKHDCLAELQSVIGLPTWRQVMGLARISTDNIVKTGNLVHQTAFDNLTGDQTVTLGFVVFDDVVNRTASTSGSYVLPTDDGTGTPFFPNPDSDLNGLIRFTDFFNHNSDAYLIENGSNRIHKFTGPPMVYDSTIFDNTLNFPFGASIAGDIWTFGTINEPRIFNVTGGGGTKNFDVTTNFPGTVTTDLIIHSAYEISSSTHVTAGIYMLWSARTSAGSPQPKTYRISRVVEQATTFEVVEHLVIQSTSTVIRDNTHIWHRMIQCIVHRVGIHHSCAGSDVLYEIVAHHIEE